MWLRWALGHADHRESQGAHGIAATASSYGNQSLDVLSSGTHQPHPTAQGTWVPCPVSMEAPRNQTATATAKCLLEGEQISSSIRKSQVRVSAGNVLLHNWRNQPKCAHSLGEGNPRQGHPGVLCVCICIYAHQGGR